jgi:hypothetical protein
MSRLPSTPGFTWDEESLATLRRMICVEGKTFAAIGRELGTSKNSCIAKARRLNIRPSAGTPLTVKRRKQWAPRLRSGEPTSTEDRLKTPDRFPPHGCCVYPLGHPHQNEFRFCGVRVGNPGEPYCPDHRRLCWIPGRPGQPLTAE